VGHPWQAKNKNKVNYPTSANSGRYGAPGAGLWERAAETSATAHSMSIQARVRDWRRMRRLRGGESELAGRVVMAATSDPMQLRGQVIQRRGEGRNKSNNF
jgi:hypothetical protein